MYVVRFLSMVALLGLAAVAGGCDVADPYVYKNQEFNRSAADFGREPEDRESVSFCYSKYSTTPQELLALARETCGKYQRVARFVDHGPLLTCPVATPALARFACERP